MTVFGDTLENLREKAGLTQQDLAQRVGVTNTYISSLEIGSKPAPPYAIVIALAETLGVAHEVLWGPAKKEREERLQAKLKGKSASQRRSSSITGSFPQPIPGAPAGATGPEEEAAPPNEADLLQMVMRLKQAIPDAKKREEVLETLQKLSKLLD